MGTHFHRIVHRITIPIILSHAIPLSTVLYSFIAVTQSILILLNVECISISRYQQT